MIKIYNKKIIATEYNEDLEQQEENMVLSSDQFIILYNENVEFSTDLTIEGFITALQPFFSIIDTHFIAYTNGHKMERYFEEMIQEPENRNEDIEYIEMFWSSELFEWNDDVHNEKHTDFSLWGDFHGVPGSKEDCFFSFGLSPINDWKHYGFKLNKEICCYDYKKPTQGGTIEPLFRSTKEWTLHDVIKYFLIELTFYGCPEDAEAFSDKLDKQVEDIKSGKEKGIRHEYILLEFLEKDLKAAEALNNFEGCIKIQLKIEKLKKEIETIEKEEKK